MLVTDDGMVTAASGQPAKALSPMDMTDDGIVTAVSDEQLLKASLPMDVTEDGIVTPYTVEDGVLTITATRTPDALADSVTEDWISGGLNTQGIFQQTYGYFEARILPSAGKHNLGMCPAFWLPNVRNNGDDGNCEIDVMEIPGNPKFGGGHTVWGTVHATHDSYANGSAHGAPRISPRESLLQVLCVPSKSVYVLRERHFRRFLER